MTFYISPHIGQLGSECGVPTHLAEGNSDMPSGSLLLTLENVISVQRAGSVTWVAGWKWQKWSS